MITDLFDMLFGCWHTRYSFPITPRPALRVKAARKTGSYVVCLDCGKEFGYDFTLMRVLSDSEWPRQPSTSTILQQSEL